MALFRAVFWIAVVIVLGPRVLDPTMSGDRSGGPGLVAGFQTAMLANLTRVKADLKSSRSTLVAGPPHR
jgi:hypothetical protein